ncbi:single-stranded DNA-binding protein [Pseudomonas graminis]
MITAGLPLPCQTGRNGEATYWLGVVALGKQAELLAWHQNGDLVSVAGNMLLNHWAGRDGAQKEQPQVIADSVISARTACLAGKLAQQGRGTDALRRAQQSIRDEYEQRPPFDDEAPF